MGENEPTAADPTTADPDSAPPPVRRRWPRRLLVGGIAALLVLVLVGSGWLAWSIRRAFPTVDGELAIEVLDAPVDVLRGPTGIADVYAGSVEDLYRAQGFVHAQERFWQMDMWRIAGAGRTAEVFGADQVETDVFLRTISWRHTAEQEVELLSSESLGVLEAYAEGVNAWLASTSPAQRSLEYTVLGLLNPDYEPDPWTPVDTLAFLKLLAWDLRSNFEAELERSILLSQPGVGAERAGQLYPDYDFAESPTIMPRDWRPPRTSSRRAERRQPQGVSPPAEEVGGAPYAEALAAMRAIDRATGTANADRGSNSWVVPGGVTASGAPILANDPHLSIQLPNIWFQMGLHCAPQTDDCREHVTGFSVPGVPGVVIGHNDRIAWGLTNLGADVTDFYVELVDAGDPTSYLRDGEFVDMEVREDVIRVAGGEDVPVTVRTTVHGPVLTDAFGALEDVDPADLVPTNDADSAEERAVEPQISVAWTALQPGTTFEAIRAINLARDHAGFRDGAEQFIVPSQNLVYADVDGLIAYQAPGAIPIRCGCGGADTPDDGTLPQPGWRSEFDWQGFIPFETLPALIRDRDDEPIVTANNAVVAPGQLPDPLIAQWPDKGYRAGRITQLLDLAIERSGGRLTVQDLAEIQVDERHLALPWLLDVFRAIEPADDDVAAAQELLVGWDGVMAADSAGAALFAATWSHVMDRLVVDEVGEAIEVGNGGDRWYEAVQGLLDEPDAEWWDDVRTDEVEDRNAMLSAALAGAVEELTERLGGDPEAWRWGELHGATFRNGTLGESGVGPVEALFNRGPFPVGGGTDIVNATGWAPEEGYEVASLPSMRMVVDLGDLDGMRAIHPTGQSGHARHPNYIDLAPRWAAGELEPVPFTREAVEERATHRLALVPG